MKYDKRNRVNISKLADNTRQKALEWYQYCIDNNINILIYETIRDKKTQQKNVSIGVSRTMKSYHLVGQALDFVPVDSRGRALWDGYNKPDIKRAISRAKQLGFEWGGDWKSFVDMPHLQYNYRGYGTDTFGKSTPNSNKGVDIDDLVVRTMRGEFGNGDARKKALGSYYDIVQDIINGKSNIVDYNKMMQDTIRGLYGNGEERKRRLGKHYNVIQRMINSKYK